MKHLQALTFAAATLVATTAFAAPVEYAFDKSHSNIAFSYNHLGYSITDGRFKEWDGTLIIDEDAPENSSVEVTIDMNSLDTFWEKRDAHIKSGDFLDVANFPEATFKSTKVEKVSDDALAVTGDLTIHGVTKPVVLDVKVHKIAEHPMAKKRAAGFAATTSILRSEFGVSAFIPNVGDEITISIQAETLKK
ncbi:YceI family protein [Polycladidibacter hongkongensis]|uniref:YceI family protein n=1 Tax=Polycladidibacter hongkongensis TaxID=1647556 RepID=UPI0008355D5E|nr:YceI family protein [Pseudovibrio hongkongensis]